jgi:hypothetical protein
MKINRLSFLFLIGFVLFLISACDTNDGRLHLVNKSNKIISFEYSNDSLPNSPNKIEYYRRDSFPPNSTKMELMRGPDDAWLRYIRNGSEKKLYLFVYDYDTLIKYDNMDTVRKKRLYVKKISFSEKELNDLNWQVEFNRR